MYVRYDHIILFSILYRFHGRLMREHSFQYRPHVAP